MRKASLVALAAMALLLFGTPAGASGSVGQITVSNPSPARESAVGVASTGWRPGGVVSITLAGVDQVLGHATADVRGAVHARVVIPAGASLGFDTLSVTGPMPGGAQQQIVAGLSVVSAEHAPASRRPWTAILLLAALAALLLLACQRVEARDSQQLAAS
jgi:hypothetical protein